MKLLKQHYCKLRLLKNNPILNKQSCLFNYIVIFIALIIANCCFVNFVIAFEPEEKLAKPKQEERAQQIFRQIRCLTCKGQVVESSSSDFAFDIRGFVRKKIADGATDKEVFTILQENFGEEILQNRKINRYNALFWLSIFAFSAISLWLFASYYRKVNENQDAT